VATHDDGERYEVNDPEDGAPSWRGRLVKSAAAAAVLIAMRLRQVRGSRSAPTGRGKRKGVAQRLADLSDFYRRTR